MLQKLFTKTFAKRYTGVFLTISLFTLTLSGQYVARADSKPDISRQVELQWYVIGNGRQDDTELVEKEINKYLKDKLNATLKLNTLSWGEDFEQKMNLRIAAGEPFDITFTSSWALNYSKSASIGAFKDITGMLDTYAPKTKAFLGESILKGAKVNGKIYAIPTYNDNTCESQGILLNKKLVEKYKIDTSKIKKIEDVEASFKIIKAKEPKINSFYPFDRSFNYGVLNTLNYDNILSSYTFASVRRDGKSTKVINPYETGEAKSLFGLMNKWYKRGYISKSATADYEYFHSSAKNTFSFFSRLNPSKCNELLESDGLDLIPISLNKPSLTTEMITSSMQAISATSKNPERALMLLELVNTDKNLSNLINYGIEGVHYKKTGERTITHISPAYEKYNPGTPWLFGSPYVASSLQNTPLISEEAASKYLNSAVPSPLLGFSLNIEPIGENLESLNKITRKYYNNLCLGKVDPSVYLPKMNKELKNAGLQKVLTEMQKQIDVFISKE
jgi:putative aldouronate transport system substrate-binding protein